MLIPQLHRPPRNWTRYFYLFSFCLYHLLVKCVIVSGTRRRQRLPASETGTVLATDARKLACVSSVLGLGQRGDG